MNLEEEMDQLLVVCIIKYLRVFYFHIGTTFKNDLKFCGVWTMTMLKNSWYNNCLHALSYNKIFKKALMTNKLEAFGLVSFVLNNKQENIMLWRT